ncbi:MAG: DUF885 family protein, partial [Nannocystaceae bacterium]|nr:DUF885 family protein [Nannocystaceae bacterium]
MIALDTMLRHTRAAAVLLALPLSFGCVKTPTPTTPPPTPPPAADPGPVTAAQVGDTVFDAWFSMQPVTATAFGDHRYDGRWPDLSAAGIAADLERIETGLTAVAAVDRSHASVDDVVDLGILETELLRQKFAHEVEQPWRGDPLWYATILGNGLEDLVSRDYAPITERAQSTAARLEALPAVVDQAINNLTAAETMKPHATVALAQLAGIKILINEVIPARVSGARPTDRERVAAATEAASTAIDTLAAAINDDLLPNADGQWRLGPVNFERKLRLTLGTDLTGSEIRRAAILEHA